MFNWLTNSHNVPCISQNYFLGRQRRNSDSLRPYPSCFSIEMRMWLYKLATLPNTQSVTHSSVLWNLARAHLRGDGGMQLVSPSIFTPAQPGRLTLSLHSTLQSYRDNFYFYINGLFPLCLLACVFIYLFVFETLSHCVDYVGPKLTEMFTPLGGSERLWGTSLSQHDWWQHKHRLLKFHIHLMSF